VLVTSRPGGGWSLCALPRSVSRPAPPRKVIVRLLATFAGMALLPGGVALNRSGR
jgi:hypothetical protein